METGFVSVSALVFPPTMSSKLDNANFHVYLRKVLDRKKLAGESRRGGGHLRGFFGYDGYFHFWTILVVSVLALTARSVQEFRVAEVLRQRLERDLASVHDGVGGTGQFWTYIERLVVDRYSAVTSSTQLRPSDQWVWIAHSHRLCGTIRLRQLRVRKTSCLNGQRCFPPFKSSDEDSQSLFMTSFHTVRHSKDASAVTLTGKMGVYGPGGYVVNLNTSQMFNSNLVQKLKMAPWLDRATRAVALEFTTFSPNVNLFISATVLFEFPAQGGVVASTTHVRPVKLVLYHSVKDRIVLGFELIYLLLSLISLVRQFLLWKRAKFSIYRLFVQQSNCDDDDRRIQRPPSP